MKKEDLFSNKSNSTMVQGVPGLVSDSARSETTITHRTEAVLRGLRLVCEHHSVDPKIIEDLNKQVRQNLNTANNEMVWLTRCKYLLTYPLAKYLKNPLPKKPDAPFSAVGLLRRFMKARLIAFNRKNTHFWYSWLQVKRCTLPASEQIIEKTYDSHLETLTRRDPGDDVTIDAIFEEEDFKKVLDIVSKRVAKLYKGDHSFVEHSASGSACFESTRAQGGQQGFLRRLVHSEPYLGFDELHSMTYQPRVYTKSGVFSKVLEKRQPFGYEDWQSLRTLRSEQVLKSLDGPVSCTIQGILEPMKVRVISKGEGLPYYSCKPLQKALHTALRSMPCFRLIGRPLCPTDFIDLSRKSSKGDEWFSIDYSAATDGLSWKYSGRIFEKVISRLSEDQKILAHSVLAPHKLYYPTGKGGKEFRGVQQNGQLMGSILSFPILCLANLGVYLRNTRFIQRGWTLSERLNHVLVNGDDMVYSCVPSLWDTHVEIAQKVGLEMSVGKAYRHPVYANVNSTSVHLDLRRTSYDGNQIKGDTPWQIDYLNSGLFFGQHKVQNNGNTSILGTEEIEKQLISKVATPEEICSLLLRKKASIESEDLEPSFLLSSLNWLMKGSLPGRQRFLLADFLKEQKSLVQKETLAIYRKRGRLSLFTRNLFLPIPLGGFGIEKPLGFKTQKPSTIQLKVANQLCSELVLGGSIQFSTQRPLPGFDIEDFEDRVSCPWSRKVSDPEIFSISNRTSLRVSAKKLVNCIPYTEHKDSVIHRVSF